MKTSFFLLITLVIGLSGCNYLVDPITKAQGLIKQGKFQDAIYTLEKEYELKPNSVPLKSILATTYTDYGIALCKDESKPPKEKYPLAKEQFAMALDLNPYLDEAKEMYGLIEKIQASFAANKLE